MTDKSTIVINTEQSTDLMASDYYMKPTATIHIGNNLTFIERKLFNLLVWHSQINRLTKKKELLHFDELMGLIGLNKSRNKEVIQGALETLVTSKITWNTLERDRTNNQWGVCTFLAGAEISNGKLRYLINPFLIDKIENPSVYAKIQLLVQAQFRSKYSLILYEFIIDELSRRREKKLTVDVNLDDLRKVLQYDGEFKTLNKDVLKPSVKEINAETDIELTLSTRKKGRKVVAIILEIERKDHFQLPLNLPSRGLVDKLTDEQEAIKEQLMASEINEQKSIELVLSYSEERILNNINYVNQEVNKKSSKVRNAAAYLIKAIEHNYSPSPSPKKTVKKAEQDIAAEYKQAMEKEFAEFRDTRVKEIFEEQSEEWKEDRQNKFIKDIKANKYPTLDMLFKRGGMESKIVKETFWSELKEEVFTKPEEKDFDEFVKWKELEKAELA